MINRKDVIRVRMPFPNISSELAVITHMYICRRTEGDLVGLVKCQTLKPYMFSSSPMHHFWDETPDKNRNPFQRTTRIDCDKEFVTNHVQYDDLLKTPGRPNVCEDVMTHIESELIADGFLVNNIDEIDLVELNRLVTFIA